MMNLYKTLPCFLLSLFFNTPSVASTSLFNGKDLTGWKIPKENEKLVGTKQSKASLNYEVDPKRGARFCGLKKNTKILKLNWNLGLLMEPLIQESI